MDVYREYMRLIHMQILTRSVAPMAIRKTVWPFILFMGGSITVLDMKALLASFSLAEDFNTTQAQSLDEGDTVTTTSEIEHDVKAVTSKDQVIQLIGQNVSATSGVGGQARGSGQLVALNVCFGML